MATHPQLQTISPEQYLALEHQAETKSEYVDGVMYAMSGASIPHNILVANLIISLGPVLRTKGCQIFPSDLKVRQGNRFFYPDVSAICGDLEFHDSTNDVVLNPALIIEVLSPSTERYDKGLKFLTYQQIPSLQEYLLVHQDRALVEQYRRHAEGSWLYQRRDGLRESVQVLGCELDLAELYEGVSLEVGENS